MQSKPKPRYVGFSLPSVISKAAQSIPTSRFCEVDQNIGMLAGAEQQCLVIKEDCVGTNNHIGSAGV